MQRYISKVKLFSVLGAAVFLGACHHGIDPDELQFPPELNETGITANIMSEEDTLKALAEINNTPYPAYTIQGGDVFKVRVYNEEDMGNISTGSSLITPDGYLVMQLIEPLKIKDLTITEATRKLREELKKFIKHPEVSLIPDRIQGKTATLYGAIKSPGLYEVTENTRLSDIIARGGGWETGMLYGSTVDLSDASNSYIIRDGKMLPVDFTEALHKGNQLHNIKIFPQDIIFVANRQDSRVIVIGEVKGPQVINWTSELTVMEAIAKAQGLLDDYWGTALILRKPRDSAKGPLDVYKVNVDDLIAGRERDFRLASGDIVYIPKDALAEYNVFIRKLLPTAQLVNALMSPPAYWFSPGGR